MALIYGLVRAIAVAFAKTAAWRHARIQKQLENPLAEEILSGRFVPGDTIRVDLGESGFSFTRKGSASSAA